MDREGALALLARAKVVHLASTTPDGAPVLKTVHGVVDGDGGYLCFHGSPAGEKSETLGRAVVASAEEIVAEIPSYFIDPERACPATTYYRSAQVHGVLEPVEDPAAKARVLQALMERFQPEGGHAPITAGDSRYRAAVNGLSIVRISLERLDGKSKLGQNRKPEELRHILEQMWRRGHASDPAAIELVRAVNPAVPSPAFLAAPDGARLRCTLGPGDARAAAALLAETYWNVGLPLELLERSQSGSTAWVGAHDASGRLIGCARAIADGAKQAWIYDVMVAPEWRGRALGRALVRLIVDHPSLRACKNVRLNTCDAQGLYRRFGFVESASANPEMILRRECQGTANE